MLADKYGFKYQPQELYRPHTTDSGIHEAGWAIDLPVARLSAMGRKIIKQARADGFYVHDVDHGSGDHIHIEFNRNPDGSAKRGMV